MKREKDIGLLHIEKLNIQTTHSPKNLHDCITRQFGQKRADDFFDKMENGDDSQSLYRLLGYDDEVCMAVFGCYDADIVRKTCNWIYGHQDIFGDTILEIGCGCGFITTFIGELFPNKHIVSIDRNQDEIELAKRNVEKFGLTNVEIKCADVLALAGNTYDTVLSVRTVHENGDDVEENPDMDFLELAGLYRTAKQPYAQAIHSLLCEDGSFVSIERTEFDPYYYGWVDSLLCAGFSVDTSSHEELKCIEVGEETTLEALAAKKCTVEKPDATNTYLTMYGSTYSLDETIYEGWDAKLVYEVISGEIISEYETTYESQGVVYQQILANRNDDSESLLLYCKGGEGASLQIFDKAYLDKTLSDMEQQYKNLRDTDGVSVNRII